MNHFLEQFPTPPLNRNPYIVPEYGTIVKIAQTTGEDKGAAVGLLAGKMERDVVSNGMGRIKRSITIHPQANLPIYYDSQELNPLNNSYLFFQAKPSNKITKNWYTDNPLPGHYARYVIGLEVGFNFQTLSGVGDPTLLGKTGWTNGINPMAILNALKNGVIRIKADQNEKLVLHAPLTEYLDFESIGIAASNGTATSSAVFANLKTKGTVRVDDPFMIAPNQTFITEVTFDGLQHLPTAAEWATAGAASPLEIRVQLQVAEIKR